MKAKRVNKVTVELSPEKAGDLVYEIQRVLDAYTSKTALRIYPLDLADLKQALEEA